MTRLYPLTAGIGVLIFFTCAKARSVIRDIISDRHLTVAGVPVDDEDYGTPVAPV